MGDKFGNSTETQQQGDIGDCPGAMVKFLRQRENKERPFNIGTSSGKVGTDLS